MYERRLHEKDISGIVNIGGHWEHLNIGGTMSDISKTLRGLAALMEMLNIIGAEEKTDSDVAKVLTRDELDLRSLADFIVEQLDVNAV